jgi:hypothetical protein
MEFPHHRLELVQICWIIVEIAGINKLKHPDPMSAKLTNGDFNKCNDGHFFVNAIRQGSNPQAGWPDTYCV